MSKLKLLSQDDLATISDDFGEILESEVSKCISMKELEDLDLDIVLNYENEQFFKFVSITFFNFYNINVILFYKKVFI